MKTLAFTQSSSLPRILLDLIELTKPRITFLVLFTASAGLWLAPVSISSWLVAATLIGLTLAVGGVNALNMYLERDLDGLMTRTRNRPLPARRLDPELALWFGLALSMAGVALTAAAANLLTGLLTLIAVMTYVTLYTPLKPKSPWALQVGAIPGAMPPLIGWAAATGSIGMPAIALFAIIFFWQTPHFLAIALFRRDEYKKAGIKVLPVASSLQMTRIQIVLGLFCLLPVSFLPVLLGMAGLTYASAAAILGGIFFGVGLQGLWIDDSKLDKWAHLLFIISLVYLTVIYALLFLP